MLNVFTPIVKVAESAGMILGIRSGTEEPAFTVVERIAEDVEVRQYGSRVAAQTAVQADDEAARSIGFRRLARYIFGGNHARAEINMTAPVTQTSRTKIAMTAPVAQSSATTGSVIQFFMPSSWTLDTLPEPDDSDVTLIEVPGETVAVVRFTGDRSPIAVARKAEALRNTLALTAYDETGESVAWFYDPPFTLPFRRRNEVAIPVSRA